MTDVPMNLRELAKAIALGDCRAAAIELDVLARDASNDDDWTVEVALGRSAAAAQGRSSILPAVARADPASAEAGGA